MEVVWYLSNLIYIFKYIDRFNIKKRYIDRHKVAACIFLLKD